MHYEMEFGNLKMLRSRGLFQIAARSLCPLHQTHIKSSKKRKRKRKRKSERREIGEEFGRDK
jgi:hypothetical protein